MRHGDILHEHIFPKRCIRLIKVLDPQHESQLMDLFGSCYTPRMGWYPMCCTHSTFHWLFFAKIQYTKSVILVYPRFQTVLKIMMVILYQLYQIKFALFDWYQIICSIPYCPWSTMSIKALQRSKTSFDDIYLVIEMYRYIYKYWYIYIYINK